MNRVGEKRKNKKKDIRGRKVNMHRGYTKNYKKEM